MQALLVQQHEDGTITWLWKCTKRKEDGYFIRNVFFVHYKVSILGTNASELYHPEVKVNTRHSPQGTPGVHFPHNKIVSSHQPHFTWQYFSACPECQKAGRLLKSKVPMAST